MRFYEKKFGVHKREVNAENFVNLLYPFYSLVLDSSLLHDT